MLKFKLIKDENIDKNDIKHVKIYESENYKLRIFEYESGYNQIDISKEKRNIPNLHLKSNYDNFKIETITIETTGYGSLEIEEIQEVIDGYNIAIESVKKLKEILKENNLLIKKQL